MPHTSKGTTYWPTYQSAHAYATANNLPTNRIIAYTLGWAIQLRISGPYVNASL
jgi:hypothetical protein